MSSFTNALGLDIGASRIGVARVNSIAQLTEPLCVIKNDENFISELNMLIKEYDADLVVVGLPRNMNGEKTHQTAEVELFTKKLVNSLTTKIVFQDETLSTVAAAARTTKKTLHMEDAVAASVILEDYLRSI